MFTPTITDHVTNPRNVGVLADATVVGTAGTPGRGNYMVLHFRLEGDTIAACTFQTFGCAPAIAAGSVITELVTGKRVAEALAITAEEVDAALGGLPLGRKHCASLAVEAVREGLGERKRGGA